jgi:ubiquinone/menaquinone biosynthesis C-methylase UbiE
VSNGVVNLAPDKPTVFREAARLLKRGGRLALADIVTEVQLPEGITCDATLWAACIGGAMRADAFRNNPAYQFISDNAQGATKKYGVKSVSIQAVKA